MIIDLNNIGIQISEPGIFLFNIEKVEEKMTYFYVKYVKVGSQDYHFERYYLGETVLWRVADLSKAAGTGSSRKLDTDQLVGKKVVLELIEDNYNGNINIKVKRHFRPEQKEAF